jgi:5-formyltetrahydrofolate cyclo-ligase
MIDTAIASRKRKLRQQLRQSRRGLSTTAQAQAGRSLSEQLLRNSHFQQARHIACYFPADGEIDTRPLMRASLAAGKQLYLPVITRKRMQFHPYQKGQRLYKSRFGLLQPRPDSRPISSAALDLVIVPLVGFDKRGARLGMGGGFYDRFFQRALKRDGKPLLLGVAHSIQQLDCVPLECWDRTLHAIVTESAYLQVFPGTSAGEDDRQN